MTLVWLGALLLLTWVVFMAAQPLWRGRLSGGKRLGAGEPSGTLEPQTPAGGFGIRSNWSRSRARIAGAVLLWPWLPEKGGR